LGIYIYIFVDKHGPVRSLLVTALSILRQGGYVSPLISFTAAKTMTSLTVSILPPRPCYTNSIDEENVNVTAAQQEMKMGRRAATKDSPLICEMIASWGFYKHQQEVGGGAVVGWCLLPCRKSPKINLTGRQTNRSLGEGDDALTRDVDNVLIML
jgi:hypothetical protein